MDDIHPVLKDNEVGLTLRRSSRKRRRSSKPTSSVCDIPTPSKQSKNRDLKHLSTNEAPSLTSLPSDVIRKLLNYLDVEALECLSKTCFYFVQLIAGKFLLSIDFPFNADMNAEVACSNKLEKKPLLKMRCKKTKVGDKDQIMLMSPSLKDYVVHCQLSLLSLDKLRELDLVPEGISRREGGSRSLELETDAYDLFDYRLLQQISRYIFY